MTTRRGSFLLFCIALITVLVALGFALLQTVRLSADAGTSSQRAWLAQEAAIAGTSHALENLLTDYRTPGQPTFLDGVWHRDFYALGQDRNQPGSATVPGADDDVRDENQLWSPLGLSSPSFNLYGQGGKARYYEVDYYDPADRTATRFTDASATLPPRHGALFLDPRLLRVQPVGAETDDAVRRRARYRLRYAVIVNDTGSNLLLNPALDADYRDAWRPGQAALSAGELPSGDPFGGSHYLTRFGSEKVFAPTVLGRRLERYSNSLYNMLNASMSAGTEGSAQRLTHIFRLRGSAANTARDANGWPVTFPLMFRSWDTVNGKALRTTFGSADPDISYYRTQSTVQSVEGGLPITSNTISNSEGYASHALVGPQFSFRNVLRATAGGSNDVHLSSLGQSSQTANSDQQLALLTPFGRAGEQGDKTRDWQWNRGPTDVPWVVNALTAPAGVTHAMIGGYLPPPYAVLDTEEFSCYKTTVGGADIFYPVTKVISLPTAVTLSQTLRQSRDLFTDFMSPAFAKWPAPWVETPGTSMLKIWPNGFIPDPRTAAETYPGPYASRARLASDATKLAIENTGKDIDADTIYPCFGWDSHSANELCDSLNINSEVRKRGGADTDDYKSTYTAWELSRTDDRAPATPVAGPTGIETPMPTGTVGDLGTWGYSARDRIVTSASSSSPDMFTADMAKAFSTALSVLRAHWVRTANTWTDPVASFPAGRLTAGQVGSIADLDRLFLQQLGIDIGDPTRGTVMASWALSTSATLPRTYRQNGVTLKNNIRTLVLSDLLKVGSVTSVMRARAMELMLNDWRMSFLGASPDYRAAFRPLDFDGDGWALCSGYDSNTAFGDDVGSVTWPRQPAAGGVGPAPDTFFSLTGCFTIGKSHYFRVMVRGEVWDSLLRKPLASATQETVVAIDPDGNGVQSAVPATATGLDGDLTVLYQRWYWNRYNGLLPTVYP